MWGRVKKGTRKSGASLTAESWMPFLSAMSKTLHFQPHCGSLYNISVGRTYPSEPHTSMKLCPVCVLLSRADNELSTSNLFTPHSAPA